MSFWWHLFFFSPTCSCVFCSWIPGTLHMVHKLLVLSISLCPFLQMASLCKLRSQDFLLLFFCLETTPWRILYMAWLMNTRPIHKFKSKPHRYPTCCSNLQNSLSILFTNRMLWEAWNSPCKPPLPKNGTLSGNLHNPHFYNLDALQEISQRQNF